MKYNYDQKNRLHKNLLKKGILQALLQSKLGQNLGKTQLTVIIEGRILVAL